ncbi:extracellular solute-binding protein [Aminobacter sp. AP02]|uniref:ABC transporter substrate-binding protein n=1 Tax=Aminobacter sp. AP02 TaxID=2135737 RepID=UPI000D6A94DF|nr:extracellular solute-binding protein [Aminobacter sp. AP02]PWK61294.1 ABC-type Fe3+ transport system substrate-binding protein [Aminobacter sp. AP02]
MTTRTKDNGSKPLTKMRIALLAATAMVVLGGNAQAASAYDTTDPEYIARANDLVAQGKITKECLPSSATAPNSEYKPIPEPTPELIAAASNEGQLILNAAISDKRSISAIQAAFELRYPKVKLQTATGNSASLEERFLADHAAGNQQADAAITTKIQWIEKAFKEQALLPLDETIPGIFDTWPGGSWKWETKSGSAATPINRPLGIAYNSDLVKGDLIPKQFKDLARPEFKGQLLAVDPEASVTFARVWKHIMDSVGEDTMKAIGNNMIKDPLYSDIQPASQVLGAGGAMVIMELGANVAASMQASGAPVVGVMPDTATGTQYAFGVATKAPHPNAAKLFAYWFHSAEGQWVSSCAAYAGTLAYPENGTKKFVPIEKVSAEDIAKIKQLLGL